MYQKILANGLSVRDTESLVKDLKTGTLSRKQTNEQAGKSSKNSLPDNVQAATKQLNDKLDAQVVTSMSSSGKGKMTIAFASRADFQRIVDLINGK
jgi:ParB family chromosome partitioning protein